jgi:hypothetical protein
MDPNEYVSYFLIVETACKTLFLFNDKEIVGYVSICEFAFTAFHNKLFVFAFKETIDEHRKTFSPGHAKDFIDSFLEEMEARKNETDSTFNGQYNLLYSNQSSSAVMVLDSV